MSHGNTSGGGVGAESVSVDIDSIQEIAKRHGLKFTDELAKRLSDAISKVLEDARLHPDKYAANK